MSLNGRETMRFLVTGGAGFLGSSLVESLVELGHDVVVLDNLWRGKKGNLHTVLDRISLIEADACLPSSYASISDPHSIDVVYHLAAINGTKWFHEKSRLVMDVNINSTLRSLEFAEDHAGRYVVISSPEAYGESEKCHSVAMNLLCSQPRITIRDMPMVRANILANLQFIMLFATEWMLESFVLSMDTVLDC